MNIKRKSSILLKGIIIGLFFNFFVWAQANAIPTLQLDIEGGTYDSITDTIITTGSSFTLYALLIEDENEPTSLWDDEYILVAALTPKGSIGDFGTFEIDGNPFDTSNITGNYGDDMYEFGTPPPGDEDVNLGKHSIYETTYAQLLFNFVDGQTTTAYNSEFDFGGGFIPGDVPGDGTMYWVAFEVDVSGMDGALLHFDLYQRDSEGNIIEFAPFSHDAEVVPEPATLALLGSGLAGLALYGRKRSRKKAGKVS